MPHKLKGLEVYDMFLAEDVEKFLYSIQYSFSVPARPCYEGVGFRV